MQKQSFDLHELFQHLLLEAHAAWRYRWHALIVAWCIAIVGALLVFSLPNQYKSSAEVYANTDALRNPLLHGISVQPNVRGRLNIITHTLLSRPNLEAVADKTGLSVRATSPADKDALMAKLGNAVKVHSAGTRDLYKISYTDSNPQMTQKVVQAFLQILMNNTLGSNTASAQSAQRFLKQQVQDYANRLDTAHRKLSDFKKANVRYLPTAGGDYSARLAAEQAKLDNLQSLYAAVNTGGAPGGGPAINPEVASIDHQIDQYQQKLDQLLLKYTDQYPDVVETKRMIKQLKERRAKLPEHVSGGTVAGVGSNDANTASARILGARIASQKQQIADLEGNADKITDVQAKLKQLTRDFTTTRKQYNELVSRLNRSEMSQAATQTGNNLKFRIVEPPIVPTAPSKPRRGLLLLVVFVFAVGFGGVFAWFLHQIRPVFTSLKSLRDFGDLPVIGTFSLIVSGARRRRKRREVVGFCTGLVLLAVVLGFSFVYDGHLAHIVQHVFVAGVS